ncbi:WAT1-related protein At5g64700-like isoform X1 [Phoenix dactylifera]|uniref:WAT1-related protein n=1 Tax=Phoenix dactylifera TaxID=42345 RepID=A0A8B7D261_PHODC|nr:WAT1-related protein At5g64700-like isoform X1 [Phoenix dactylifera]
MNNAKVYLVAVLISLIRVGMQILTKAAFNTGMSTTVFVFYRQASAALFLTPIAFVLERKRAPPLPFMVCFKIFMLAFLGLAVYFNILSLALDYTSATLAAAMINFIPVLTFIFAVLFGMEAIKLRSRKGIAKVSGVVLCLAGILTMAFYKGPHLKSFIHHSLLGQGHSHSDRSHSHSHNTWILGTFLMTIAASTLSLWMVLQGPVLQEYPSKLLFTTLQCHFGTAQSFFIALASERDFSRWKLGSDINLIAVGYGSIIGIGVSYYLQSWTIEKRGPVFLAMFMPLTLVITMILSSFLLAEQIGLGSVLGGSLMVGGLYSVLWGKSKEHADSNIQMREDGESCLEEKKIAPSVETTQAT